MALSWTAVSYDCKIPLYLGEEELEIWQLGHLILLLFFLPHKQAPDFLSLHTEIKLKY